MVDGCGDAFAGGGCVEGFPIGVGDVEAFGEFLDAVEFGVGEAAIGDEEAHGLGARGLWGRSGTVLGAAVPRKFADEW